MTSRHKPLVLIVLDGFGYSDTNDHNAIKSAYTPVWDQLWQGFPHMLLGASGAAVGLPEGQMGNSEVGHLHMGAGRAVPQDLARIDQAVEQGTFFHNTVLKQAIERAKQTNNSVHILGLLSPGGVHSHEQHIFAMIELAAKTGLEKIYLHAFLDGRDTPPKSALASIEAAEAKFKILGRGRFASLCGRYYAMDRDNRWDRTQQAYDLLTSGRAKFVADSAVAGLAMAYERGETDEFVKPTLIKESGQEAIRIANGDVVVCMNFRSDRLRQLSRAFTSTEFAGFDREVWPKLGEFVTLTEYAKDIKATVAFPSIMITNGLGEYLSKSGCRQLRIAETEKYAHVTFFFNGGIEKPYLYEDRILISSPKVSTYDLKPEMSAEELTDKLVEQIHARKYDVIICNYANPDMVGHTGDFSATVKAIEIIDQCLKRIIEALQEVNGEALITSDHGNAECMFDASTQQAHTAHTNNLVPLVYIGHNAAFTQQQGVLYDLAPTMLYLLGIEPPKEMTGKILMKFV